MGLEGAMKYFFAFAIGSIILINMLSVTVPIAQETIDNAPAGAFAMGEASKLMIGLAGFVFMAGGLYGGLQELLRRDDSSRIDGYG